MRTNRRKATAFTAVPPSEPVAAAEPAPEAPKPSAAPVAPPAAPQAAAPVAPTPAAVMAALAAVSEEPVHFHKGGGQSLCGRAVSKWTSNQKTVTCDKCKRFLPKLAG